MSKCKRYCKEILQVFIKRKKLILLSAIICSVISILSNYFMAIPRYEAEADLLITLNDIYYEEDELSLYEIIKIKLKGRIKATELLEKAINKTNYDVTPAEIIKELTVSTKKSTKTISLKYSDIDAIRAENILSGIIEEIKNIATNEGYNCTVEVIKPILMPLEPVYLSSTYVGVIAFFFGMIASSLIVVVIEHVIGEHF